MAGLVVLAGARFALSSSLTPLAPLAQGLDSMPKKSGERGAPLVARVAPTATVHRDSESAELSEQVSINTLPQPAACRLRTHAHDS